MALAERRADAIWHGNLTQGSGMVKVGSGALPEMPVTWAARTEQPGGKTSPEELIAAAHAACFAMALSNTLNKGGTPPEQLNVSAVCTLDRVEGGVKITTMDLSVRGKVPGLDAAGFERAVGEAEQGCPVSNALRHNVEVKVTAHLEAYAQRRASRGGGRRGEAPRTLPPVGCLLRAAATRANAREAVPAGQG